jgi:hypothetical protein
MFILTLSYFNEYSFYVIFLREALATHFVRWLISVEKSMKHIKMDSLCPTEVSPYAGAKSQTPTSNHFFKESKFLTT